MPKDMFIDPKKVRVGGTIRMQDIPSMQYRKSVKDELKTYQKQDFLNIFRDMSYIREFETMLKFLKTMGEYKHLKYDHPGAAHYGLGEEPAHVGMAFCLTPDDFIFGTHRSHGEIIAKGLRAIETMESASLMEIMEGFFDGEILRAVEAKQEGTRELARDFLLYGVLAEIFGKRTGFNKGLGGGMHAFFTPFGVFPNNAIVGGSAPLANGAALFKKSNSKPGIVVCNTGDGSLARGPVWESMVFASMDQFKGLWEDPHRGGMPILFNCVNNQYGMGGQTSGETMGFHMAARIGAGINPEQMHAERVDGFNVLAVIDAFKRKKELLLSGEGPVFLDTVTYRYEGHSPSDFGSYRTQEEIEAWRSEDGIEAYKDQLIKAGVASLGELEAIQQKTAEQVLHIGELAIDEKISPRISFEENPDVLSDLMLSNQTAKNLEPAREPEVLIPKDEIRRVQQIAKKHRTAYVNGEKVSQNKVLSIRDAMFEPIVDKFYEDPTFIAFAEEIREWDGAHGVTRGLTSALPYHRLFNTPIAETAILGGAIGYAMCGGRAMVELMYGDFLGCIGDEIINQMAKWQAMSAGVLKIPVILRVPVGLKYGAQHSQDLSALMIHVPGLKVVYPATPADAKGLMTTALDSTDPVIFFEAQRTYDMGEMFHEGGVPEGRYEIPFGEPDIKKVGTDLTILTIGPALYRAMDASKILEEHYGVSVEVIDARSLVPFNYAPVVESVKKTGKIVIVGDGVERGSVMRQMASTIVDLAFDYLDAPPTVVGSRNMITPAHELESYVLPQAKTIVDAVHERILPLPNHVCTYNMTAGEQLRLNRRGV